MNNILYRAADKLIADALAEDIGTGDITSLSVVEVGRRAQGKYIAKEDGILCGIDICERVFHAVDPSIKLIKHFSDGDKVQKGDIIANVSGSAISLLSGERTGLNIMQRLSGIATATAAAVKSVSGTKAKIADTRKTTPSMRVLEKYAVKVGGGSNHRFNLADGVMIKDNHIVAAGSITNAVSKAKANAPHTLKIEVEVESLEQVKEALAAGADIIMLDNMSLVTMREAVAIVSGRAILEASGNMGERDLFAVASTGVDIISIGALTHSVKSLDISLKFTIN